MDSDPGLWAPKSKANFNGCTRCSPVIAFHFHNHSLYNSIAKWRRWCLRRQHLLMVTTTPTPPPIITITNIISNEHRRLRTKSLLRKESPEEEKEMKFFVSCRRLITRCVHWSAGQKRFSSLVLSLTCRGFKQRNRIERRSGANRRRKCGNVK